MNLNQLYKKSISIIEENICNSNLNGAFIAAELGVNRMYLHRKLKLYCNKNAGELIQEIRIARAKDLLIQTDTEIFKIGKAVGYTDNSYFTKKFKTMTGQTPSVYKKSKV